MKNPRLYGSSILIVMLIFLSFSGVARAQKNERPGKIIGTLDFDPKTDGFGFQNYGNQEHDWEDDLTVADMILLFGAKAVCVTGKTAETCVEKRPAEEWRVKTLQIMDGGHCEGMAVTSLSFFEQREFKKLTAPADFQPETESVNELEFPNDLIENYIAYFFVTQLFDGVYDYRKVYMDKGPVKTVKDLVDSMNDADATVYTLAVQKYENGKFKSGHAITPIAVEEFPSYYRIHVYDNNFPGETRYVTVQKGGKQTWQYHAAANPKDAASLYTGDLSTRSFFITPNEARYGKLFPAPFATDAEEGDEDSSGAGPETVEILVNDDADLLVTSGDGKRIGYDPAKKQTVNEIGGAKMIDLATGADDDLPPVLHLPYQPKNKPYTVTLSGKSLKKESRPDLIYSGPGFSVGFDGVRLDPNETLVFQISPDGKKISFTASADGETPEMYFSVNAPNGESYLVEVDGVDLQAGKTLTGEFDSAKGTFFFRDDDGAKDKYDVDFERVLSSGKIQKFETDNLDMGSAENFEMDFGEWDGQSPLCFRDDQDGKGFANDECVGQPNEDNDTDPDDADDEGDDEDSDIDNDGRLNNADDDDDGDGITDDQDPDDDGDGEVDGEDEPQFFQILARLMLSDSNRPGRARN
jgi:hypothetical protein